MIRNFEWQRTYIRLEVVTYNDDIDRAIYLAYVLRLYRNRVRNGVIA